MSASALSSQFTDLKGAHNNLTDDYNDLKGKFNQVVGIQNHHLAQHNATVRVVDQQGQSIRHLQDRAEADTERVNATVQVLNAHTLEFRGQQARIDELSRGLATANETLAASQRALAASEQARLDDKQAFDDRIKKLEENSTATTAISSQVNALMERFANMEQLYQIEKQEYAKRLIAAELAIGESQKENLQLKATVVTLSEILEEVTIIGAATHRSFFGTVNTMDRKLDQVLDRLPLASPAASPSGSPAASPSASSSTSPAASQASGQPNTPPPAAAAQPASPYRNSLVKLNDLRVQRQENPIVTFPTSALVHQPPAATGSGF